MIAFDLDGTLVDSRLDLLHAVNALRSERKLDSLAYENTWPDLCRGMPHLYRTCFAELGGETDELRVAFEAIYLARIFDETRVFDGIESLLSQLHGQVPLAVVTNKPQVATEAVLNEAKLASYFEVVVGGDRCSEPKPSPIPLEFAYAQTQRSLPLVMVGDSKGDVVCGQAADALTVWCEWGYWSEVPNGTGFVASQPADVLQFLNISGYNLR